MSIVGIALLIWIVARVGRRRRFFGGGWLFRPFGGGMFFGPPRGPGGPGMRGPGGPGGFGGPGMGGFGGPSPRR